MLDITDPINPKQLFAINNDATNKEITHWNTAGFQNIYSYGATNPPADLDYRKLGETWSTPRIIRIKVNGTDKWVAVLGGGYNKKFEKLIELHSMLHKNCAKII